MAALRRYPLVTFFALAYVFSWWPWPLYALAATSGCPPTRSRTGRRAGSPTTQTASRKNAPSPRTAPDRTRAPAPGRRDG